MKTKLNYYLQVAWRIIRHGADINGTYLSSVGRRVYKNTIRYRKPIYFVRCKSEHDDTLEYCLVDKARVITGKSIVKYLSK